MRRMNFIAAAIALALSASASSATLFIDNAKVHTAGPQGTLATGDVIVIDGVITAVAAELAAPAGATRIDAKASRSRRACSRD